MLDVIASLPEEFDAANFRMEKQSVFLSPSHSLHRSSLFP